MICFTVCFRRTWSHDERWHLTVSSKQGIMPAAKGLLSSGALRQ
jgi:hypothetical protein